MKKIKKKKKLEKLAFLLPNLLCIGFQALEVILRLLSVKGFYIRIAVVTIEHPEGKKIRLWVIERLNTGTFSHPDSRYKDTVEHHKSKN
jgi:hypothetical protein